MARGTEEQEQTSEVNADFPYRTLMTHPAWGIIDKALGELESNDDLEIRTARRYIIGYLIQQLAESGQMPPAIAFGPDAPTVVQPKYRWLLEVEVGASLKRGSVERSRRPQATK